MAQNTYKIEAFWDAEAAVWVATSDDVPGLATEAETIEALTQKLEYDSRIGFTQSGSGF